MGLYHMMQEHLPYQTVLTKGKVTVARVEHLCLPHTSRAMLLDLKPPVII